MLTRWFGDENVWNRFNRMQNDMDRLWSTFGSLSQAQRGVFPPINIYDDGESFIARAELPGIDPVDIELSVTGNTLTIQGKREIQPADEGCCYHRRERRGGQFRRAVTLPADVDGSKVNAVCTNGILEILLPRSEQSKLRKIKVQSK